jgi:hypothetical protein
MQELGIPTNLFKDPKLLTRDKKNKSRIRNKVRRLRKSSNVVYYRVGHPTESASAKTTKKSDFCTLITLDLLSRILLKFNTVRLYTIALLY